MEWYFHFNTEGNRPIAKFLREDSHMSRSRTDSETIFGPLNSELLIEFLETFDAAKSGKVDVLSLDRIDRRPILLWMQGYLEGMQHALNNLTHHD
jgi:hypothetical protein